MLMNPRRLFLVGLGQEQCIKYLGPLAEQQVIENLLGKRVAKRQGYHSKGPSLSSTDILMSSEISTLRQQLADSLKAQEDLREELRRQYEDSQKQMQDQATMQVQMQSQIQLLLSRVGMDGSGSSER